MDWFLDIDHHLFFLLGLPTASFDTALFLHWKIQGTVKTIHLFTTRLILYNSISSVSCWKLKVPHSLVLLAIILSSLSLRTSRTIQDAGMPLLDQGWVIKILYSLQFLTVNLLFCMVIRIQQPFKQSICINFCFHFWTVVVSFKSIILYIKCFFFLTMPLSAFNFICNCIINLWVQ